MQMLLTCFGAFVGAVAALFSDRWAQSRSDKLAEEAAINGLILDLAGKRVLAPGPATWAPEAEQRIVASVLHIRTLVRDARLKLRPRSPYLPAIREMQRACSTFVEETEYTGDRPTEHSLERLVTNLHNEVNALHRISPRHILDDKPGSFSMHPIAVPPPEP